MAAHIGVGLFGLGHQRLDVLDRQVAVAADNDGLEVLEPMMAPMPTRPALRDQSALTQAKRTEILARNADHGDLHVMGAEPLLDQALGFEARLAGQLGHRDDARFVLVDE